MGTWWNSLDAVSAINVVARWVSAVFGVLAAFSGLAVLVSGIRLDTLRGQRDQAKEAALSELKEQTRPRALTDEQVNLLSEALSRSPNKIPIEILTLAHNPPLTDASELCARQLTQVFKEAGWHVSSGKAQDVLEDGIRINVFIKEAERPPVIQTLLETFEKMGQYHRVRYMENVDPKNEVRARITIGLDARLY